eukprot:Plantae.Rhodophyta-Purpureofilum_apyrenoidigerum.ctg922.p1 GENE.Plantae.Rhodophyta-Purpureofilum_apyrenoidigerum.ctg922~~Plantae.Rhodophyta-Purpureofilum_apyrenoidigerum.ctg922.p1  ORF type:complete len:513 (-),score=86.95 Plantae.Rhodophyta-Purpureofilum_apyrenoidigerum.ctg922:1451-2989(-)
MAFVTTSVGYGFERCSGLDEWSGVSRICSGRVRPATPTCIGNRRTTLQASVSLTSEESAENFFSPFGFQSLGLSNEIAYALREIGIDRPTSVQTSSIPAVYGGADVVIGAATGSGKTLAYLLPVLQMMKDEEVLGSVERVPRRPRALLVVPTRELAEQVLRVAKSLSHHFKFRSSVLIGGDSSLKKQKDTLGSGSIDLLISTTGRLLQHLDARNVDLVDLKHVIVDEVDTMIEGGFGADLGKILSLIRKRKNANGIQFTAAGATHPPTAVDLYKQYFPGAKFVNVDLHRAPPGLQQRFISTSPGEKTQELIALLGEAEKDGSLRGGRIIVFTNSTESCRFVDHFLSEKDYTTSCIHGEMPRNKRIEEFEAFKRHETQLLVGTDVAARGLDNLSIDHVVLFDFPTTAVDYIHRAGRTARAGASGRVTSFVTKRDRTLAEAIQEANKDKVDTIERARIRRREADKRKIDEARLNTLRLEKEKQRGKKDGKAIKDDSPKRGKGRVIRTKAAPKRK